MIKSGVIPMALRKSFTKIRYGCQKQGMAVSIDIQKGEFSDCFGKAQLRVNHTFQYNLSVHIGMLELLNLGSIIQA